MMQRPSPDTLTIRIDYPLLQKQRRALEALLETQDNNAYAKEALEGIQNLLDTLSDWLTEVPRTRRHREILLTEITSKD